jgi:hypothetical protein
MEDRSTGGLFVEGISDIWRMKNLGKAISLNSRNLFYREA